MTPSPLDLAALISSKLCHDIISPVGAIANGIEIMQEDKDPEMRKVALDLASNSANLALVKLQYARVSFGAAGSHGAQFDLREAEKMASLLFEHERADLSWNVPAGYLDKDKARLLLNLILMANSTIPRGGSIRVDMENTVENPGFLIVSQGPKPKLNEEMMNFFEGREQAVTPQNVHFYYAKLLSDETGMAVTVDLQDDRVTLHASASA